MNTLPQIKQVLYATAFGILLTSCGKDPEPTQPYDEGVLVSNAGNFLDNNGSLSLMKNNMKTAELDVFMKENNRPITGGISGYAEMDGKGIILVDNATAGLDKVEIVNARTLKSVATLSAPDIENPRAVVGVGTNKVYLSCWGATGSGANFFANAGYIAVIDLVTNKITKKIPVQKGAEGIVVVGNQAFVGGTGGDRLINVIDITKDEATASIAAGAGSAGVLQVDANNKIWTFVGREAVRIDPASRTIEARIRVGTSATKSPGNMTMGADKKTLYFTHTFFDAADNFKQKGELYSFNIVDATIATTVPVASKVFTGLGFDPKNNVLYAGFTPSFKQAGFVFRYQSTGQFIDSVRVEIAPSGFWFK